LSARKEKTITQAKLNNDYIGRNNHSNTFYHEGGKTATAGMFTRRIGNTVYRVNVHSSSTSKETMGDKIIRLVKNDVSGKAAGE